MSSRYTISKYVQTTIEKKTDDLDVLNLILYSLISKYFWCTGSYSSHVTLRNLFRSLDPESGLSSWSFGSLEGEKKIYNFKNNRARKTNVRRQIYSPWILFVYKAHLSFRQPIRTFFPIYPPPQLSPETNNKIPKAFSNFKAWGLFQYYPDRNPSIPPVSRARRCVQCIKKK